jgi:hypothetical protein
MQPTRQDNSQDKSRQHRANPKTSQDNTGRDKATLIHKRLSSNPNPNSNPNPSTNPNPNPSSNPNPDPRGTNFWKACAKLRTVKLRDTMFVYWVFHFHF